MQVVKNISACTKNINKFPLKTSLAHPQTVVVSPTGLQKSALSSVDSLQVNVSSNNVVNATPQQNQEQLPLTYQTTCCANTTVKWQQICYGRKLLSLYLYLVVAKLHI